MLHRSDLPATAPLAVALLIALAGCDSAGSPGDPFEPAFSSGRAVNSVTGGGQTDGVSLLGGAGTWTLGIAAHINDAGEARGQIEFHRADNLDVSLHIEVNCINVVGNTAWIGGPVKFDRTGNVGVGTETLIQVVDNGQGRAAPPDRVSEVFGGFLNSCLGGFDLGPQDWLRGNVTIW